MTSEPRPALSMDRARIRSAHESRQEAWQTDPKPLTVRAAVRVVEDHRKTARVGAFTIESDEGTIVGGAGTAPSPLSYFVSAIGFSVLTDLVRAFAVFELPVDELSLDVEADFPLKAKYGGEPVSIAASSVRYDVSIASPAPRERIAEAVAWAERHCHAVHSLREPVRVEGRYQVGGEPLTTA